MMENDEKEYKFVGTHILGEMYGINKEDLNNIDKLVRILNKGISKSKATCEGLMVKEFQPSGVTVIALLSESHVSIHTYPEICSVFVDAFTCGVHCNPKAIIDELDEKLSPTKICLKTIIRGKDEYAN